jgi:hypothetical protein
MDLPASLKQLMTVDVGAWFGPSRQLLGLDIGSSAIKLVQMRERKGKYILQKFGVVLPLKFGQVPLVRRHDGSNNETYPEQPGPEGSVAGRAEARGATGVEERHAP